LEAGGGAVPHSRIKILDQVGGKLVNVGDAFRLHLCDGRCFLMKKCRSLGGGQYHCHSWLQAGSDKLLEYLPEKEKLRDKTIIIENTDSAYSLDLMLIVL
jgi:adenylate cyclase